MQRRSLGLLSILFAAGCHSDHAQFVAPQPEPQDPLETIARYEDARIDGDGLLQTLLQKGDTRTRERAAVALGRLDPTELGAEVTDGLVVGLGDESGSVRAAAAFGLGERADPSAAGALLAHWHDPDPNVRARIVEAGSRIDDARLRAAVLSSLDDSDPRVRSEALIGPSRFPAKRTDALDAEALLVEFLARSPSMTKPAPEANDYWRALFTFSRNKSPRTSSVLDGVRSACVAGLASSDARVRIFAAQGLASLVPSGPPEADVSAVLRAALRDPDWRVACEAARALSKHPDGENLAALAEAAQHPNASVRRAAIQAAGTPTGEEITFLRPILDRGASDVSVNVRAAALLARAEMFASDAMPQVEAAAVDKDPRMRCAAASAAEHVGPRKTLPMLLDLSTDENLLVAEAAIAGLGVFPTDEGRTRLRALLSSPDNGLRLSAVEALRENPVAGDVEPMRICLKTSTGEISPELAAGIMAYAVKVGGDPGVSLAKEGLQDPDPFVRKKAKEAMAALDPSSSAIFPERVSSRPSGVAAHKDKPSDSANPRVEVKTNRGTMTFELFPAEAPNHVRNLLELAARHHYDGLTFHRVELDFVIQGGDHRGDGNGGITWNDAPLRAEFTPRKFVRGSLGMPRNDDPDSGGSQFFVTHRDTPHLDGRYTNFGMLVAGFDTLDAIEVGDTIQTVRVVPAQ